MSDSSSHEMSSIHEPILDNDQLISAIDALEKLPSTQFYSTFAVPRVGPKTLRGESAPEELLEPVQQEERKGGQFGTFGGVFLRCTLNIISVVFYLRLGWVVGNCGLGLTIVLILISTVCTSLTALCLSALSTNGTVKGGGVYYFISRSLGADFGGTIGVIFGFSVTFATVLHVFGFVEVVRDMIGHNITKDGKFDIPILGISLVTFLVITVSISLAWEVALQYVLGVVIGVSVIAILFGFARLDNPKWTIENLKNNWGPDFRNGNNFFSIFAVYFPACTGILAGANISGDLKNPQKSIPIGTLGAIFATSLLYIIVAIILAAAGTRDVLHSDNLLLSKICLWKWLVTIGVIAASVSSASAALVGGPKIFQALCKDDILPKCFRFFAVGKKSTGDPIRVFIIGWVMVVVSTFIFDNLDAVGTVITQFFLIGYVVMCMSCFVASMSKSPAWRPAWKYYHPAAALLGSALCLAGMFLTNWIFALCVCAATVLLFMYFHWSDSVTVSWGEFPQSLLYSTTVTNLGKLKEAGNHVKTYRPQIEFMFNYDFEYLDKQTENITPFQQIAHEAHSLLVVSYVGRQIPEQVPEGLEKLFSRNWGEIDLATCARLIANAGSIGRVGPNMLAIPWIPTMSENPAIFDMVGSAFDNRLGVAIARGFESFSNRLEDRWPIDVWWLSDDGGLILLLAYLLEQNNHWKHCQLRVFTITKQACQVDAASVRLTKLLQLFRIEAEIKVFSGLDEAPSRDSLRLWSDTGIEIKTDNARGKVHSFLKLREMLLQHSGSSSLVLCTLPIPKATGDPLVWLGILNVVSDAMPPFIWVHGNNENVMTFLT